jgi:hypothetical protein
MRIFLGWAQSAGTGHRRGESGTETSTPIPRAKSSRNRNARNQALWIAALLFSHRFSRMAAHE